MPIYEFKCPDGHVTEILASVEHDKVRVCDCGKYSKQIPSLTTFRFAGRPVINDAGGDDPWEGTPLAGMGEPNVLTYKSDKLFMDQSRVSGKAKPVDWAQKVAEAQAP
jgi:putative FmdB family regulatory protein